MRITFSFVEVKEILISALVLSVAFSLAYSNGIFNMNFATLPTLVLFSFIAVGVGFLAHELIGHKIIAQHYGMHAEFRMWPFGLVLALASSLVGFVFAAPGAVYVQPKPDFYFRAKDNQKHMGIVSIAGPIVNITIALIFLVLSFTNPLMISGMNVFAFAFSVNVWLALFNLVPIPPLDGSKVLAWNKFAWLIVFAITVGLFIFASI
jgi:Zn-dependent protease